MQNFIRWLILLLAVLAGLLVAMLVASLSAQHEGEGAIGFRRGLCYLQLPSPRVDIVLLSCSGRLGLNGEGVDYVRFLVEGESIVEADLGGYSGDKLSYIVFGVFPRKGEKRVSAEMSLAKDSREVYKILYSRSRLDIDPRVLDAMLERDPLVSRSGNDRVNITIPGNEEGFLYALVRPDNLCRELTIILQGEEKRVIRVEHFIEDMEDASSSLSWAGYVVPLWDGDFRSISVHCPGAFITVEVYKAIEARLELVYSDGNTQEEVLPVIPGPPAAILAPP